MRGSKPPRCTILTAASWRRSRFHWQQNAGRLTARQEAKKTVAAKLRAIFRGRTVAERLLRAADEAWRREHPDLENGPRKPCLRGGPFSTYRQRTACGSTPPTVFGASTENCADIAERISPRFIRRGAPQSRTVCGISARTRPGDTRSASGRNPYGRPSKISPGKRPAKWSRSGIGRQSTFHGMRQSKSRLGRRYPPGGNQGVISYWIRWRPQRDLNPCCRRERPVSWTWLDDGDETRRQRTSWWAVLDSNQRLSA